MKANSERYRWNDPWFVVFKWWASLIFARKWIAINLYLYITGDSTGQKTGKSHHCALFSDCLLLFTWKKGRLKSCVMICLRYAYLLSLFYTVAVIVWCCPKNVRLFCTLNPWKKYWNLIVIKSDCNAIRLSYTC